MTQLPLFLAAALTVAAPCLADQASWIIRPADPFLLGHPPRYTPVTAGVQRFRVVEPKNWLELNRPAAARGDGHGRASKKGMDHHGVMPGMKMEGMDHGSMPGMKMDGKGSMP
jgi:hypothetical protein